MSVKSSIKLVILGFGLGLESTSVLCRWIFEPDTRDFDLEDLVVLTMLTGGEWDSTGHLVTTYILPLLRAHNIRFVQVGRAGPSHKLDGIVVLDDSRQPEKLHLKGKYRLDEELKAAGTLPTWRPSSRLCSIKTKAVPGDTWIRQTFGDQPFRHVLGFNAEELKRVERDKSYATSTRHVEHPLVEWGWDRAKCEAYLFEKFGVTWLKSACKCCAFSNGKTEVLERYNREPEAAYEVLEMEKISMSLNPAVHLFPKGSLRESLLVQGYGHLVDEADARMAVKPWALYRIRRIARSKRIVYRKVEYVATGTQASMTDALAGKAASLGIALTHEGGIARCYLRRRDAAHPLEEMYVAAPSGVEAKSRKCFEHFWAALNQPRLFS